MLMDLDLGGRRGDCEYFCVLTSFLLRGVKSVDVIAKVNIQRAWCLCLPLPHVLFVDLKFVPTGCAGVSLCF